MKYLIKALSLSAVAVASVSIAGQQATPCNPHQQICYLNGVNHSYFAHNQWQHVKGMTLHHDVAGEPYLSTKKSTGPKPVAFYLGVMSGVNFEHAHGNYSAQLHGPSIVSDSYATEASHGVWQYGAYMGFSFHGKKAAWLNGFHPEISLWNSNATSVSGVHKTSFGTPLTANYNYDLTIRALGLNAIFDAVKWKDARVMLGGGVDLAQLATSKYNHTVVNSKQKIYFTVLDHTDTRVMFDLKAGVGVHFLNHLQANVMYTYYPTFNYRTGDIKETIGQKKSFPGIQTSMSLQTVAASLAYTF
jgi:hypothetical protein